jgi:TPR repeat protein
MTREGWIWARGLGALALVLFGPLLLLGTPLARVGEAWATLLVMALWALMMAFVIAGLLWTPGLVVAWLERRLRRWVARFAPDQARLWLQWARGAHRPDMARWCLDQAAEVGGAEARFQLGLVHLEGSTGPGGRIVAMDRFRQAAALGHAEAAFRLAEAVRTGAGQVLPDYPEAEQMYQRAAGLGFGPAAAWLAQAYAQGDGVAADEGRSRRWAEVAERLRPHPELSRSLLRHDASPEDPLVRLTSRAVRGLEGAADQVVAHPLGRWALLLVALPLAAALLVLFGTLFWAGSTTLHHLPLLWTAALVALLVWQLRPLLKDRPWTGRDRLLAAAEAGDPEACYQVGLAHRLGTARRRKDDLSAVLWFRKAAEAGHREAMAALAEAYLGGHGVLRDPREAARWAGAARGESTS